MTTPTAAAMRAAKALELRPDEIEWAAAIIDAEFRDVVVALEACLPMLLDTHDVAVQARAALAKVTT